MAGSSSASAPETASIAIPPALSLTPMSINALLDSNVLVDSAQTLLESIDRWAPTRSHNPDVKTHILRSKDKDKETWQARQSTHSTSDVTFQDLWSIVGTDGVRRQSRLMPSVQGVTLLRPISEGKAIWSIEMTAKAPFSPRIYSVLRIERLVTGLDGAKTGISVMRSVDVGELDSLEESGVKGRLVTVEWVQELPDSQTLDWRLAVAVDEGGLVPDYVTEKTAKSRMAKIVGRVLASSKSGTHISESSEG